MTVAFKQQEYFQDVRQPSLMDVNLTDGLVSSLARANMCFGYPNLQFRSPLRFLIACFASADPDAASAASMIRLPVAVELRSPGLVCRNEAVTTYKNLLTLFVTADNLRERHARCLLLCSRHWCHSTNKRASDCRSVQHFFISRIL